MAKKKYIYVCAGYDVKCVNIPSSNSNRNNVVPINLTHIGTWQPKGTKFNSTHVPMRDTSQPI